MDDFHYSVQTSELLPGETVFLYTDGLTEAMNTNRKQFGQERITATLDGCSTLSTEQIIGKVKDSVKAFVDSAEQSDDLTMLAVKYTPKTKEIILQRSITLKNDVRQVGELNAFTQSVAQDLHFDNAMVKKLKLAVEEAAVNVMEYAYPKDTVGEVELAAEADATTLRFILMDWGAEFDPTAASTADTTLTVDERPIGGLGILLVRNLMDSINYERIDGKNILRMEKRYQGMSDP